MTKTVAVTGGTGYIAGFVIAEFLNAGYVVRASVRSMTKAAALEDSLATVVAKNALSQLAFFEADLTSDSGWANGFAGADGVIHVASPLGSGKEKPEELREVAEGGTLHVLRSAADAGVRRIVMTSSEAAATPRKNIGEVVLDDTFWSDPKNPELDAYRLSKIASEKAAWKFSEDHNLQLTTILPGAVFGPVINPRSISSNDILRQLLSGQLKRSVNIPLETCDVRDLAALHRLAFENDAAIGERFIAADQTLWMPKVAEIFRKEFPNFKAPTKTYPDWMMRALALVVPDARSMVPMLGRQYSYTAYKAKSMLGWQQNPARQTVIDAGQSLIDHGLV